MELRVKVGASVDASFSAVFKNFADVAKTANAKVTSDEKAQQKIRLDAAKQTLKSKLDAEKTADKAKLDSEAATNNHIRQLELMRLKQQLDDESKAAAERRHIIVREAERAAKEAKRAGGSGGGGGFAQTMFGQNMGGGGRRDFPKRVGYWAMRNFSPVTPMLSYGARAASSMMRGVGVNMDVGSMVGQSVQNQKLMTDITNSGYIEGAAGKQGQQQDPKAVYEDVKKAANEVALSYEDAGEGLRKFVAKTGELETGRGILSSMGKIAKATGTSFEDMISASGDVSNALGNVDGKAEKVKAVMMAIAGQGKLGAVEIRDLAVQMAKIAAVSGLYRGGVSANIGTLGAMVQEARMSGGAASATQAATGVISFTNLFGKEKTAKKYEAATHRKLFDEHGQTTGPEELVLEMLHATKGDPLAMGKIVSESRARSFTRGFEKIYRANGAAKMVDFNPRSMPGISAGMTEKQADGTYKLQAGIVAVAAEFARLKQAALTEKNLTEAFNASMGTAVSKSQLFNNKMQDVADKLTEKVLPQLEKLAPAAIAMVDAFAGIAAWLAENPFAAIPLALGAAIAKAGIEQTLRVGIENIFRNIGGTQGPGIGGGGGIMGNAAAAFTIAAMAVTTFTVGKMFIDEWFTKKDKEQKETVESSIAAGNDESTLKQQLLNAKVKQETVDATKKDVGRLKAQEDALRAPMGIGEKLMLSGAAIAEGKNPNDEYTKKLAERAAEADKLRQQQVTLLKMIADGVVLLQAFPPTPPAAKVPTSGRTNTGEPAEATE
jgi:hypothetical protein